MSAAATPEILLVAEPVEADDIARALIGAGFSAPVFADGGDETLTLCEEVAPDVVVLCASLEQGDARALASAMRASPHGPKLRIVLVGDAVGPIRNALDAVDFAVDRFVGRPLSAKALAFAVRECARDLLAADAHPDAHAAVGAGASMRGNGGVRPATAPAAPVAIRERQPDAVAEAPTRTKLRWPALRPQLSPRPAPPRQYPILRSHTTPGTGPPLPPGPVGPVWQRSPRPATSPGLERAMEEAMSRFVSDAMNALDAGLSLGAGRDGQVHDTILDPTPRTVDTDLLAGASMGAAVGVGTGPVRRTERADEPAASLPEAAPPVPHVHGFPGDEGEGYEAGPASESEWEEPPASPVREPTLILRAGGQPVTRATPPTEPDVAEPVDADIMAPRAYSPRSTGAGGDATVRTSQPVSQPLRTTDGQAPSGDSPAIAEGQEAAVPELLHGAETGSGRAHGDSGAVLSGGGEASQPGEAGPRSPVARELRRKMSMMAERLFPGPGGDRSRLDVELAHDAHAEIDLSSIGVETASGGGGSGYEGIGSVDTYADSSSLSRLEPAQPEGSVSADDSEDTTGRRRSIAEEAPSRGDLTDVDVATLLGRLLQSRFTGRVQFRRGPAEKAIHFEDGRPVFAISNLPHDRMGDLLYREGKITREQQERARDLVVESGRRMGEILVEIGFLKPRELLPAVRHHIEDIVYSLFAWDTGEFWIVASEPTSERIRLTRHPAAIVLEGVRRKYGPELLEARLGSPAAVVAVRSQRQLGSIAAVADLSSSERAVIQKLDGERTIQQAADAAQVDQVVALQLAFGLIALGVAELVDQGPSPAERAPVRSRSLLVGETDIAIDRQRVLAKHALVHEADYFTLLGVRRDATSFEIRRAYEAARRDYSVTGFPTDLQRELAGELGEINRLIDEAYQVLRDERLRRSYQANLLD